MGKPNARRFRLESVKASYAEAVGGERVEFEVGPENKVFSFPHPIFADDEEQRALDDAEGDRGKARVLLGDQWDAFVKAGGDPNGLMLLYVAVRAEAQDTVTKHRPTRG